MTRPNDPAFPAPATLGGSLGLSTREYFAAMAMQGLLVEDNDCERDEIARAAVRMADALISALNASQ